MIYFYNFFNNCFTIVTKVYNFIYNFHNHAFKDFVMYSFIYNKIFFFFLDHIIPPRYEELRRLTGRWTRTETLLFKLYLHVGSRLMDIIDYLPNSNIVSSGNRTLIETAIGFWNANTVNKAFCKSNLCSYHIESYTLLEMFMLCEF